MLNNIFNSFKNHAPYPIYPTMVKACSSGNRKNFFAFFSFCEISGLLGWLKRQKSTDIRPEIQGANMLVAILPLNSRFFIFYPSYHRHNTCVSKAFFASFNIK